MTIPALFPTKNDSHFQTADHHSSLSILTLPLKRIFYSFIQDTFHVYSSENSRCLLKKYTFHYYVSSAKHQ